MATTQQASTDDSAQANIYDPDRYVAGPQHEVFDQLRAVSPLHWQDMDDGTGYWAVLNHADVVSVSRQPNLFSASEGGIVLEDLDPERLAMMRNMLLAMDPPRHVQWRSGSSRNFRARVIASMEDDIRRICREIFDNIDAGDSRNSGDIDDAGSSKVDFVHQVTAHLPAQVIGQLMGLPRDDWAQLHRWAEMNSGGQDDEVNPDRDDPDADKSNSGTVQMAMYAIGQAQERRTREPQQDLTAVIMGTEVDGHPMTDLEFGSFFVQLVTAGNDTTRTMLSSGLLALLTHPDQMELLRSQPALIPQAVEEMLRWANPLHYFRRTATADTVLSGVDIAAGDKVAMMYTAANRDPAVFADPHRFDITRDPNPHLSFGIAEHFCLGVHLARLEGRVFFEELLNRYSTITLAGEPRRQRSNLNNALKALPVVLQH